MAERVLRIGIDIDDVLVQSAKLSIDIYNETYGTALTLDHWYDFADKAMWPKAWGHDDFPTLVKRVIDAQATDDFVNVEPIENAYEVLHHLKKEGHKLFAVTGRPESIRRQTKVILDKYFPGIFKDETLFFVDHYSHDGENASKADVAVELALTHFIEDLPAHANVLSRAGVKVGLFNPGYKWSASGIDDDVVENITVLSTWVSVREFLDAESAE